MTLNLTCSIDEIKEAVLNCVHCQTTQNATSCVQLNQITIAGCDQAAADLLTVVVGDLIVENNFSCSLNFPNLTEVTGSLFINNNTQVNLSFPLLASIGCDLLIGENLVYSVVTTTITFDFPALLSVGHQVLIGSDNSPFSGNIIIGNVPTTLAINLSSLQTIGSNLLIGNRSFVDETSGFGNVIFSDNSVFTINVGALEKIGGSLIVGKVGFGADDSLSTPGNTILGQNSVFDIVVGSELLVVDGSICVGAFDRAVGGNVIFSDDAHFLLKITVQKVKRNVQIGAFDAANGNGTFSFPRPPNVVLNIEISSPENWILEGNLEIGAFSNNKNEVRQANIMFGPQSEISISTGTLSKIGGSVRIGSFGPKNRIGNHLSSGDNAAFQILCNSVVCIGQKLLIGAFDGASDGNTVLGFEQTMAIEFRSLKKVCGAICVGAFGQTESKKSAHSTPSIRGNVVSGTSNTQTIDISGLENLNNKQGLKIGGGAHHHCCPIVSIRGNIAGGYESLVDRNNNVQRILFSSLLSIEACQGLHIGVFGAGLRDGNYAGSNGTGNTQIIDLGKLERVNGDVCVGAFGKRSFSGNATLGTKDNSQKIDLEKLKTIAGVYKVADNLKEIDGDGQIWCYDAFSVGRVGGVFEVTDNISIELVKKARALRSTDCAP